jgi:hypothetical protein
MGKFQEYLLNILMYTHKNNLSKDNLKRSYVQLCT